MSVKTENKIEKPKSNQEPETKNTEDNKSPAPNNLEHKLEISVPAEKIETEIAKRLQEMTTSNKVKIPGFRPGKIPQNVIAQRFGASVRHDVIEHFIRESFIETTKAQQLEPASMPKIEVTSNAQLANTPLNYTATFEVLPKINLPDFSQIEMDKEVAAEITDADIDSMIKKMQKRYAPWQEITDPEVTAEKGQKIAIDFDINIEAEPPETITNEHLDFELGTGQMWEDFEKHLYDKKVGDELQFSLNFPEEHLQKQFAGKKVNYTVRIKKLSKPELPELNDDFAKTVGFTEGGMQALRERAKQMMQKQLESSLEQKVNHAVLEKLYDLTPIEVPNSLLEYEIQKKQQEAEMRLKQIMHGQEKSAFNREFFEAKARKDIAMGLLLSEIIRQQKIELNQQKLSAKLEEFLGRNPNVKIEDLQKNHGFIEELKASVLEAEALNYVKQLIKFTEKSVSYKDIFEKEE